MNPPAPPAAQPNGPPDLELFCPACGYSLRGSDSELCPECGFKVDRSAAAVSRIPWEHRGRLGFVRAYWRTLWMPARAVAADIVRPVDYRAARLFQFVTVLIVSIPLAAMAALPIPNSFFAGLGASVNAWPMVMPPGWSIDLMLPLLAGAGLRVVVPVAIVLFFLAVTGVASYFFHPPHLTVVQQNRAIAMSYYACTPIVLLLLPILTGWAYLLLHVYSPNWPDRQFQLHALMLMVIGIGTVATLLLLWIGYLRMLRHATLCTTARTIALAATLPAAWVALGAMVLVGLPWLVGFVMIVVWSFQ